MTRQGEIALRRRLRAGAPYRLLSRPAFDLAPTIEVFRLTRMRVLLKRGSAQMVPYSYDYRSHTLAGRCSDGLRWAGSTTSQESYSPQKGSLSPGTNMSCVGYRTQEAEMSKQSELCRDQARRATARADCQRQPSLRDAKETVYPVRRRRQETGEVSRVRQVS